MIRAAAEAVATIGLMLALFAFAGVVVIITDKVAEFHKQGMARVRAWEQREQASK